MCTTARCLFDTENHSRHHLCALLMLLASNQWYQVQPRLMRPDTPVLGEPETPNTCGSASTRRDRRAREALRNTSRKNPLSEQCSLSGQYNPAT